MDTPELSIGQVPSPFNQALALFGSLGTAHDWEMKAEFKKVSKYALYKFKVLPSEKDEAPALRANRMLIQGMLNLSHWRDVAWVQHAVDPESGEVLIDEFRMPTQWRDLAHPDEYVKIMDVLEPYPYHVVFTPSGVRCDCPYAEHAEADESGSTRACPHSELAAFIRRYGLIPPPSE